MKKSKILSMTTLTLDEIIQIAAGQQHLKLKGDDSKIENQRTKGNFTTGISKQIDSHSDKD